MMDYQFILEKFNIRIASAFSENNWVKTVARKLDLENEIDLGLKFDEMIQILRKSYKFAGISSNNIYWDLTPEPVRIIAIPTINTNSYITIINPGILELGGQEYSNIESCGSVPDNNSYLVKRKPFILIGGYNLEKKYIELEYGDKNYSVSGEAVFGLYYPQAWIIQHEIDHLNGVTIKDKGTLFDYKSLMKG